MGKKVTYQYQKKSFSIIAVFVCLSILGFNLLSRLNVQLNPSRSLPSLSVRYTWANASSKVIEREVTSPLEGIFVSVDGVKEIRSTSKRGGGNIQINLKKNANIDAVRFELSSLIRQAYPELPKPVSYPVLSMRTKGQDESPLLTYTLSASTNSSHIRKVVDDILVKEFSAIKDVGHIQVYGDTPFRYVVTYSTERVDKLKMSSSEIASAIQNHFNDQHLGKGTIERDQEKKELEISVSERSTNQFALESLPVKNINGKIVYLRDVASVRYEEAEPSSYYRINGLNTLNIVVYPEDGANNLKLAKDVKEYAAYLKSSLPQGYELILSYDESEYIEKELGLILQRSIFSISILLVFVLLVSRQVKYLITIVASIAVNLILSVLFYYALDLNIHLYSMAGITISLGIIIDNSIIMIDHLISKKDKKVFIAILGATLTTVGALSVVFLLKPQQQINLLDFVIVITINLSVSMIIAWYFIPSLMERFRLQRRFGKRGIKCKRRTIKFTTNYTLYIVFAKRYKWIFTVVFVLAFGIPIQLLPEKIEGDDNWWANTYNDTFGSDWFQGTPKEELTKYLGGSMRLFTEFVFENSYYSEPERTSLTVTGRMPEGCTVQQMNAAIQHMEHFISTFDEIELFNTSINSSQNARINIYFKEAYEWSSFPYMLKSQLESKAISLGGLDWGVFGVGRGFSNALGTGYRNSRIQLEGYNYDQLFGYAETLRETLLANPRIKEVDISATDGWRTNSTHEYKLTFDHSKLAQLDIEKEGLFQYIKDRTSSSTLLEIFVNGSLEEIVLRPNQYKAFDVWNLNYSPLMAKKKQTKFSQVGSLERTKTGSDIKKINQQYRLTVAYDFIGPDLLGKKVRDKYIEELDSSLPIGFKVFSPKWARWNKDDKNQYYLIFYVILCIFIVCAVLFESLRQPFSIILLIPIAFIGVFLSFFLFEINFDQGGLASFVMVAGLVVNSGIYIINDYNNLKKKKKIGALRLYTNAYNSKCIPILLTILSTILGLVPFLWKGHQDVFWYAFAAGTIGGLLFSLVAIFLYLPLFLPLKTGLKAKDEVS